MICVMPCTRNTFGNNSFTAASLHVLNNLLPCLRQDISYGQLKQQLKTFPLGIN